MAKSKIKSYESAMQELQALVEAIQAGNISVDELSEKIKRAVALMSYCKEKLRNTETDIKKALE